MPPTRCTSRRPCSAAVSSRPRPGPLLASVDRLHVEVHGESGHGARPHLARDPIPVAAEIVTALHTAVTRRVRHLRSGRRFGRRSRGRGRAQRDRRLGADRRDDALVLDDGPRERLAEVTVRLCRGIAEAHGLHADVVVERQYPATVNDAAAAERFERVAAGLFGAENVETFDAPAPGRRRLLVRAERGTGSAGVPRGLRSRARSGDRALQPLVERAPRRQHAGRRRPPPGGDGPRPPRRLTELVGTAPSAAMRPAMRYQVAQVNVARLRAPLDSAELADFVAALAPVNASADQAGGFVWRLQTEDGNATAIRAFDWDTGKRPCDREPERLAVRRTAGHVGVRRPTSHGAATAAPYPTDRQTDGSIGHVALRARLRASGDRWSDVAKLGDGSRWRLVRDGRRECRDDPCVARRPDAAHVGDLGFGQQERGDAADQAEEHDS